MRRALLLLFLVLPAAACGGTTANLTSLDPLVRAANKTTDAAGAHVALTVHITALGQDIAANGTGEIADHGQKLHLRLGLPMSPAPMEAVAAGGALYIRGGPVESITGGKWARIKADDRAFNLDEADPAKLLDYLRSSSKIERRGTATVRGVRTTHYVARVRLEQAGAKSIPLDVWVDGQGLVRRISFSAKEASASLDLFDFGDVDVNVPATSDTVDLSNLLGGG
jgi:hypothetical protein